MLQIYGIVNIRNMFEFQQFIKIHFSNNSTLNFRLIIKLFIYRTNNPISYKLHFLFELLENLSRVHTFTS